MTPWQHWSYTYLDVCKGFMDLKDGMHAYTFIMDIISHIYIYWYLYDYQKNMLYIAYILLKNIYHQGILPSWLLTLGQEHISTPQLTQLRWTDPSNSLKTPSWSQAKPSWRKIKSGFTSADNLTGWNEPLQQTISRVKMKNNPNIPMKKVHWAK